MIDLYACCSYLTSAQIADLKKIADQEPYRGGIFNPNKISGSTLATTLEVELDSDFPLSFRTEKKLGKTLEHLGGAFYLLDPSAVLVSHFLGYEPDEIVLDLCAAPGGKTISYALLHPDSLIVSNDRSFSRTKELISNLERLGIANVIVTCHDPKFFLDNFSGFFDRVILDAPCSGSGMYRKEKTVGADWSLDKVERCSQLQQQLIKIAAELLKPGGYLSYSTCSFSMQEDEKIVEYLLEQRGDFSLISLPQNPGFYRSYLQETIHLFPSLYRGEGHFIALLKKDDHLPSKSHRFFTKSPRFGLSSQVQRGQTYLLLKLFKEIPDLAALRPGIPLSDNSCKAAYSHALSHHLDDFSSVVNLSRPAAMQYLMGMELRTDLADAELALVRSSGLSLGWCKISQRRIKNFFPKGLRTAIIY